MGHSGWENGLKHRQRMVLNSSASLSPSFSPPLAAPCSPVHGDSIQYCSLRCSQQFLVLFHEASLCPSDQDKNVCNVLKMTLAQQVRIILSTSQMRKLRPREAKGLVEPI